MCQGKFPATTGVAMIDKIISDCGIDNALKSWLILDNHDTARLKNMLKHEWQQKIAQVMQFTLPGSPNLYYGNELGMSGGEDPEMRAPMRWDWVIDDNPTLLWVKKLISIHQNHRALKIGNFRPVHSEKLIAYERYTDRAEDTVIVVANPTDDDLSEHLLVTNSKVMSGVPLHDLLETFDKEIVVRSSFMKITLPAHQVAVFNVDTSEIEGYTPYKRVQ